MEKPKKLQATRILILEDSPTDAVLARLKIEKFNPAYEVQCIETLSELHAVLQESWTAMVCDFRLVGSTAHDVLTVVRASHKRLPFIVYSHEISDDDSIRLLKAGADDILLKSSLAQLPYLLHRRIETIAAGMPDVSVQTAEKYPHTNFYAALTGRGKNGVVIVTPDGKIEYANENAEQLLGLKRDLITEHYYHDRDPWHQIDRERNTIPVEALPLSIALQQKTNVRAFEHGIILPNGEIRWLSVSASPIHASDGNLISAVASFEDISHRIT